MNEVNTKPELFFSNSSIASSLFVKSVEHTGLHTYKTGFEVDTVNQNCYYVYQESEVDWDLSLFSVNPTTATLSDI